MWKHLNDMNVICFLIVYTYIVNQSQKHAHTHIPIPYIHFRIIKTR